MVRWTGLAPWEFEFPFPGSLTSTFLIQVAKFALVALEAVRNFRKEDGTTVRKPYYLFVPRVLAFIPGSFSVCTREF